jgi:acetyl-CoA decarbonylase/synthase, CODH/ACS complex subunit gamma
MPLSGIEIFKLLPKSNCGKCGVPTCLAFAMSLAAGKAELSACPAVTTEAKAKLEEASAPPIRPVVIGTGERMVKVGGETVLFRHEKRFENPPGFAMQISDTMPAADIETRLARFADFVYERVGVKLKPETLALKCESGSADTFAGFVRHIVSKSNASLILMCEKPDVMAEAAAVAAPRKPLLYAATLNNAEQMAAIAKEYSLPLAAKAAGLDELAALTDQLSRLGVKDIVLDSGARKLKQAFEDQVMLRRLAIQKKFRALGYPTIILANEMAGDPLEEAVVVGTFVAKYGGIIVMSDFQGETLFPLLVLRLNLYADPQRPLATAEGIYEIGGPGENSPVLVTSNFSLTYFIVSSEIENSRVPSYLLVKDTEGLSVMTAWAAGKFGADNIAALVKKCGIGERVSHRKIIIPGYIAAESGALEEELAGWRVTVGPREGAHIPPFLRNWQA